MKYEIEIEGVPDGWEPVKYAHHTPADHFVNDAGEVVRMPNMLQGPKVLIVRRKVRKYDWSKTLDDVLVHYDNFTTCQPYMTPGARAIWQGWQPNLHGKCPVDPEASIVRILGGSENGDLASMMDWQRVKAWQFVRLAEGYEW